MSDSQPKRIAVFGASSAIASAICRRLATSGAQFALVARRQEQLDVLVADLRIRGAAASFTHATDLQDSAPHPQLVADIAAEMGGIDVAILAHGILGDQAAAAASFAETRQVLEINFMSSISLLTELANQMEAARRGQIVVIGSVAGDRGRQSNYVYGTSKAALQTFCQGLRNRLTPAGVGVLLVKPGFVDTPMTAHIPKGPLFVSPDRVAADVIAAMGGKKDVIYTPWFWSPIMFVIRLIPESIFKRLKL